MKVTQNFTNWEWKKKFTPLRVDPDPETLTSGWAENLDFWIWIDSQGCEKKFHSQLVKFLVTFISEDVTYQQYLNVFIKGFER